MEKSQESGNGKTVRIKIEIGGEPAQILTALKQRGFVKDNPDPVTQGICSLYDKVLRREPAGQP